MGNLVTWLGRASILTGVRRYVGDFLHNYYLSKNRFFAVYNPVDSEAAFTLIRQIKKETEFLLSEAEAFQIYSAVTKTCKLDGDIAEVGVFRGGSAKLICELTDKPVHLFDTFEGLPDLSEDDNPKEFCQGGYAASLESVQGYLKPYRNARLYKGFFPSTARPIENRRFSFVHLDVDLYESTLGSLEYLYPRMNGGGVIISHDYQKSKGVRNAFDRFFQDKPEIVLEVPGCNQCLVVKVSTQPAAKVWPASVPDPDLQTVEA